MKKYSYREIFRRKAVSFAISYHRNVLMDKDIENITDRKLKSNTERIITLIDKMKHRRIQFPLQYYFDMPVFKGFKRKIKEIVFG